MEFRSSELRIITTLLCLSLKEEPRLFPLSPIGKVPLGNSKKSFVDETTP